MKKSFKINDYSPLFNGVLMSSNRLRIDERQENGETVSFLTLFGVEVRGNRQVLEKGSGRVSSGMEDLNECRF